MNCRRLVTFEVELTALELSVTDETSLGSLAEFRRLCKVRYVILINRDFEGE